MSIFKLPDLGEGLPDAEIHQWYVAEGDEVTVDQPLAAMETAKAVVDVPSPQAGRILKLYGQKGDIIQTGAPLLEFESAETTMRKDTGTVVGVIETSNTVLVESPTGISTQKNTSAVAKAMPAARALAAQLNIDLTAIQGTGPQGSITVDDVKKYGDAVPTKKAEKGVQLHGARRVMAQYMIKSHAEVVPVTITEDADLYRWPEKTDITIRIIQAISAACSAEPILNSHFYGTTLSHQLRKEINLGIAVDSSAGLYVPVIKNIADQSPENLRKILDSLKEKSKSNTFTPEDLQDATITLSNFGSIAGRYASPIILPPTVAIIGIGKTRPTVVAFEGSPTIHPIMPVSLTFDHRAATGGEAARFLAAFVENLMKAEAKPTTTNLR